MIRALLLAAALTASAISANGSDDQRNAIEQPTWTVARVIDGDTLDVQHGRARERIRVLGIDTPETHRPGRAVECGGRAATRSLRKLAPRGRTVTLTTDRTQAIYDRYGRVLAYVEHAGRDLGRRQLERGHATTYVYRRKPFERLRPYRAAERRARRAQRGVWAACGGQFHRAAKRHGVVRHAEALADAARLARPHA